jgi:lysophospholipase L1-like esterase
MIRTFSIYLLMFCLCPALASAELRILAVGDSNTWGSNASGRRHGENVRWGRVLDGALPNVVVFEEGRIGRRTDLGAGRVLDNIGQRVAAPLPEFVAQHLPLHLAVVMLGTNDLQNGLERNADQIARSAFSLARVLKSGGVQQVLVVVPPPLTNPEQGRLSGIFGGSEALSEQLPAAYARMSRKTGIPLYDASTVVRADGVDGVHLTARAQRTLGEALAPVVASLLGEIAASGPEK